MNEPKLLSAQSGLSISSSSWWTENYDSWRSSWSIAFESKTEHFLKLISNINLSFILSIVLKNELLKSLLDSLHIEIVLLEALGSQILQLGSIERLVDANQIVLNPR